MSRGLLLLLACLTACSASKPPYTYPGCPGSGGDACSGSQAFSCALETIHGKYDHCDKNSECGLVFPSQSCQGGCQVAVNASQAGAYRDEVANESQRFCGTDERTSCHTPQ